jgi:hypothetical protein
MSWPTQPEDLGQEAQLPRWFRRYLIDKSYKLGK